MVDVQERKVSNKGNLNTLRSEARDYFEEILARRASSAAPRSKLGACGGAGALSCALE